MAEDEERREGSKRPGRRDPARNMRRDPPVIEGQAEDVTPAGEPVSHAAVASESTPAAQPEPAPEMPEPLTNVDPVEPIVKEPGLSSDPLDSTATAKDTGSSPTPPGQYEPSSAAAETPEPDRRMPPSRWSALTALGFVVLAAAILYLFSQLSSLPPDTSGAVVDLRGRLAALESRPTADAAGLGDRLTKLERASGEDRARLESLSKRVDETATAASTQGNVGGQVTELQTAVAGLKTDLADLKSTVSALPRPDTSRLEARLGDLDQKVAGLQGAVTAIPHVDLGPLTGKVDSLEARLTPIERETSAARSPEQVAQRRAAPVAVTAQAISGAIDSGQAFPSELHALQALGADPAKLAPLQAVADNGAPSLRDLQASLADVRDRVVNQGATPATGSYMDRLVAGASNLVQVRPLGSVLGDTPSAILARMNDAIGRDDLAAALGDWHKLPEASQSASKALADRVKLRLDAEQAAKDIAANAIGAMALPRG